MNDKTILLECEDCGEVFLGDNLCDGYMCPICESGSVVSFGVMRNVTIKEIEENIKAREKGLEEDKDTIARAKKNGLIRTYNKRKNELTSEIDYSSKGDETVGMLYLDTTEVKEKLDEIEEQLDRINNKTEALDYEELYEIGTSTLASSVDEISNTAVKEMAEIIKDAMRMLIYK